MEIETLKTAMQEAERFLKRAEIYLENKTESEFTPGKFYYSPKHSGALKRASLDLTRSLADLRQGR